MSKAVLNLWLIASVIMFSYALTGFFNHLHPGAYMDFINLYTAGKAVLLGNNLYLASAGNYIYPPFFAFIISPLMYLSFHSAVLLWLLGNLILLSCVLWLMLQILGQAFKLILTPAKIIVMCAFIVLLTYDQIRWELIQGQSDLLILAILLLALLKLDRIPLTVGVLLGMTVLIKYQTIVFLPFLLLRGRWKVGLAMCVGIVFAAFIPAVIFGWDRNWVYLQTAFYGLQHMGAPPSNFGSANVHSLTWIRSISLSSALTRITLALGFSARQALIPICVCLGLIFGGLWWIFRHYGVAFFWRPRRPYSLAILTLEWSVLLLCLMLFSPQTVLRHMIVLLMINALAVMLLMFAQPKMKPYPLLIALLITQIGYWIGKYFKESVWSFIGGPAWALLPLLFIVVWNILLFIRRKTDLVTV